MISTPSSLSIVIIETDASASMASCRSLCTPLMVTAIADLARPGPISFARS